jgi:hypothetical protein
MAIIDVRKDRIQLIYKFLESQNVQSRTSASNSGVLGKGKVHPCTGSEALYTPYSP